MTREDAQRKVRALRNTAAPGSGATDPERATAARLADKLEADHGLDQPTRVPRDRGGVGSFTVNVGRGNSFYADGFPVDFDAAVAESIRAAMRLNEAEMEKFEAKRRLFRDILSGKYP